jgi:hypothetical protein
MYINIFFYRTFIRRREFKCYGNSKEEEKKIF